MKYYLPRPIAGYVLLSIVGSGIFASIVLAGYGVSDIEVPDENPTVILLIGFCLSALFFTVRAYYKRNFRNNVELGHGYIEWETFKGRQAEIEQIATRDIRLFEIVYSENSTSPWIYRIFGQSDEKEVGSFGLDFFPIPHDIIVQYCKDYHISPHISTIKYQDIANVKVSNRKIKIEYHPKRPLLWRWGRTIKIPFSKISNICFVSTHPISKMEDHYTVTTIEGETYKFPPAVVKESEIKDAASSNAIQIVRQNQYGKRNAV